MTQKKTAVKTEAAEFFAQNSDISTVEAFIVDANGVLRGKWLPVKSVDKLFEGGLRMARSVYAVDIWGNDVLEAGLVTETGDTDGVCYAVPGSLKRMSWLETPTAQLLLTMKTADGKAFYGDPRHILERMAARYKKRGLKPVTATELEFYLYSPDRDRQGYPAPPLSPRTGRRQDAVQTYSIGEMREFEDVLAGIRQACELQGVPADTTLSENGPGQFEVNLAHTADIMAAADHAVMLKRIVKGVARRHGLEATFMAKPYAEDSGNGLHAHVSVLDKKGKNIFAGKTTEGTAALRHAIGGLLAALPGSTAVLAANINSYRRFQKGSHAPTKITWGYDNRSTAIRVPDSDIKNTRIEHRVAGADANPYLVLTVILGGILAGLDGEIDPGAPVSGNAYASRAETLPLTWDKAIARFQRSEFIADCLGENYRKLYAACKTQEKTLFDHMISDVEYNAYLRDV
ncbi:MAG: glutamine synthetase [Alphaproteobacteria bacterium]|nr:MAG: glutamine synthetase [Alphaproteobacteria bacterium]